MSRNPTFATAPFGARETAMMTASSKTKAGPDHPRAEDIDRHTAEQDAKIAGIAGKVDEQAGVFAELRRSLRRGRWR